MGHPRNRPPPQPTDLPDSERATNEPESGTPSRQVTAAPTTDGAEPSLTPMATTAPTMEGAAPSPRATARPPLAQTSPETDREVLVALYKATDGPNWKNKDKWLTDFPIGEWKGVNTDDNGRVTSLYFSKDQLSGEIPPELGNLAKLEEWYLHENQLSGEIPPELGNLASLKVLELQENQLSGCVPSSLSGGVYISPYDVLQFCP